MFTICSPMKTQAALANNSADDVVCRLRTVAHELLDIQLADLKRIAEIGMEIIEGLGLSAYVAEAFAPTTQRTAPSPAAEPTPERARKDAIAGVLTDIVHDAAGDNQERLERLIHEAGERLNETDRFADILARPMSEVVAHVCAELGLDPDWTRLSRQAWAVEEADSGVVGEALAALDPQPKTPPLTPAKAGAQAESQEWRSGPVAAAARLSDIPLGPRPSPG